MKIDFKKMNGLVPAVIQDNTTKQVLMLGYMNMEALELTKKTGLVHFFSRSKNRIWKKGEQSSNFLKVISMGTDCDSDALLVAAEPYGPTCHKGITSCFGEKEYASFFHELESTIKAKRKEDPNESYTASLLQKGINKIAQKVGEEAVELVIEAKDNNQQLFLNEAADLMYHFLILLEAKECNLDDVEQVLKSRSK